jgi:hypothetical protein
MKTIKMGEWITNGQKCSWTGTLDDLTIIYTEDYAGSVDVREESLILKNTNGEEFKYKHNDFHKINPYFESEDQKDIDDIIITVVENYLKERTLNNVCKLIYQVPIPTLDIYHTESLDWEVIAKIRNGDIVLTWHGSEDEDDENEEYTGRGIGILIIKNSKTKTIEELDHKELLERYGPAVEEGIFDELDRYLLEVIRDITGKKHWVVNRNFGSPSQITDDTDDDEIEEKQKEPEKYVDIMLMEPI